MQDRYAGDVGDFGKFVLLRQLSLTSGRRLRLGVNWYRTTRPEASHNDGRFISYLEAAYPGARNFRDCDSALYDALRTVVGISRSVRAIEEARILPDDTLFYSTPLPFQSAKLLQRVSEREGWFKESRSVLQSANVLFLDPDNGIQTPNVKPTQVRSIKYALNSEVRSYFDACDMLIVYNHRDRSPFHRYIRKLLAVQNQMSPPAEMRILRFKRFSVRDYVFLYRKSEQQRVQTLFETLTVAPFDFLFEALELQKSLPGGEQ